MKFNLTAAEFQLKADCANLLVNGSRLMLRSSSEKLSNLVTNYLF